MVTEPPAASPTTRPQSSASDSGTTGTTRPPSTSPPATSPPATSPPATAAPTTSSGPTYSCIDGRPYEGPPGHVHGGFVAAAFDEVLGFVQSTTGQPGMTGTLTIRYRKPTPLDTDLRFEATVQRVEGR